MHNRPTGSLIGHFSRLAMQTGAINLAQGKPDLPPPPSLVKALAGVLPQSLSHQYPPGNGHFALLEQIAAEHEVSPGRVLVTQGATEGLTLALWHLHRALPQERQTVLAFSPLYESYRHLPGFLGMSLQALPLRPGQPPDWARMEQLMKEQGVGVVLLANPGNPWQRCWSREELERLHRICQRHQARLIIDAVYRDLLWEPSQAPDRDLWQRPGVLYLHAFSKRFSITGWRVGYLVTPDEEEMRQIRALHDYTGLCAPAPFQEALSHFLREAPGEAADWPRNTGALCRRNGRKMEETLHALGLSCAPYEGGYFLWADLGSATSLDGFDLARYWVEQAGVSVVPGENFGPEWQRHIRISLACPEDRLQQACRQLHGTALP